MRNQRGISLLGLMFWAVLIGFFAVLVRAVDQIARSNASTVQEIRSAFDKQKEIEYSIVSIGGKDLDVTKQDDKLVIGYKYDKEIEFYGPVSLLIHYQGHSKPK
jgi:hypothetical protein